MYSFSRPHGRPTREIFLNATFVPYSADNLPQDNAWYLLGRTFFHIFWVDCVSVTCLSMLLKKFMLSLTLSRTWMNINLESKKI